MKLSFSTMTMVATVLIVDLVPLVFAEPGTYRWASTGGGWRAMGADMGFANLFHNAGLLGNQQFSAYSGTSGAAWFGTQFFYSQNFYSKTVEGTPEELSQFVEQWMDTYLNYTEINGLADGVNDTDLELTDGFPWWDAIRILADLNQILKLLETTKSWAGFVSGMLEAASTNSYQDPGFASRKANSGNRVAPLQGVDFIAQTALAPQSRSRPLNLQVNIGPSGTTEAYSLILPVTYSVSSSSGSGFNIGGIPPLTQNLITYQGFDQYKSFSYQNWQNYYLYPGTGGNILTSNNLAGDLEGGQGGGNGKKSDKSKKSSEKREKSKKKKGMMMMMMSGKKKMKTEGESRQRNLREGKRKNKNKDNGLADAYTPGTLLAFFGGNPTTTQIASISSAAAGGFSPLIPPTYAQITSWVQETLVPWGFQTAFYIFMALYYEAKPAPFDYNPLDGLAVCSQYPRQCGENDGTFIDGGYVDNPSLIMNIAQYQQSGGSPDKPVKIVLTNTNEGKFDPSEEFLPYFSNVNNTDVKPGEFRWGQFVSVMSQQIFSNKMTTEQMLKLEKPAFENGNFTTVELKGLQTVNNPSYGVKAGYTVDLFIINTNADVSTLVVGKEQILFYKPLLAKLAKNIAAHPILKSRVQEFFEL